MLSSSAARARVHQQAAPQRQRSAAMAAFGGVVACKNKRVSSFVLGRPAARTLDAVARVLALVLHHLLAQLALIRGVRARLLAQLRHASLLRLHRVLLKAAERHF
jgi:hypothetical protein